MLLGVTANSPHCFHESIRRKLTFKVGYFVVQNIIILLPSWSSEESTQKEYGIFVF